MPASRTTRRRSLDRQSRPTHSPPPPETARSPPRRSQAAWSVSWAQCRRTARRRLRRARTLPAAGPTRSEQQRQATVTDAPRSCGCRGAARGRVSWRGWSPPVRTLAQPGGVERDRRGQRHQQRSRQPRAMVRAHQNTAAAARLTTARTRASGWRQSALTAETTRRHRAARPREYGEPAREPGSTAWQRGLRRGAPALAKV
jgi:hypothetical protein